MQQTTNNSTYQLKSRFDSFNQEYLKNQNQFGTSISAETVNDFKHKLERGYCLNIACCGPCNSGKSTALNYILGPDSSDLNSMDAEIFMTNYKAETLIPWLFIENKNMSSGLVAVSHIDSLGQRSKEELFSDFNQYKNYIESHYSRQVIERIQEENKTVVKPYFQINVSYGVRDGSKRLWNSIFETGLSLLDLQGLNEPLADTTLKSIEKPFILLCCFSYSAAFLETEQFNQLKQMVSNSKPQAIIFIVTDVDYSIKRMAREKKKDKLTLIEELKTELRNDIRVHFSEFYLFLFDLNSESEEIRSGIRPIRQLIIQLRDQPNFQRAFSDEMNTRMNKFVEQLEAAKHVQSLKISNQSLFNHIQEEKARVQSFCNKYEKKLAQDLEVVIREKLMSKIAELTWKRKASFIEKTESKKKLYEKLNDWLIHTGLKLAILDLLLEKINELKEKENVKSQFFMTFSEFETISINPKIASKSFSNAISSTLEYFSIFFEEFSSSVFELFFESFDIFIPFFGVAWKLGTKLFGSDLSEEDFDKLYPKWEKKVRSNLLEKHDLKPVCENVAKKFLEKIKEEYNLELNKNYSSMNSGMR